MKRTENSFVFGFLICLLSFSNIVVAQVQWKPIQTLKGHNGEITFLYFYQQYLFSGDKNGVVKVWQTSPSGAQLLQTIKAHKKEVSHIEVDKNGRRFLTAGYDGAINVYKLNDGAKKASWALDGSGAYQDVEGMEATFANYSPDLQHIYSGGYNNKIQKINIQSGNTQTLYVDADGYGITCGEIIPGRSWLAFGLGGIIRFMDLRTEKMLPLIIGSHGAYEDYVCEIGYFPGKNWITAWLVSGEVKIYDVNNGGQLVQTIKASKTQGSARSGHAPRSGILATGNQPAISLFDITTGTRKAYLVEHKKAVSNIVFNDAENLLATGGEDNNVVLWSNTPEEIVAVDTEKTDPAKPLLPPKIKKKKPVAGKDDGGKPSKKEAWMEEGNMVIGKSFVLKGIKFDKSSYVLREEAKRELDKVVYWMKEYPKLRIALEGHTSDEGNDGANQLLSERRVRSARIYLSYAGIDEGRVETKGLGEDKPIADNSTESGREKNRRVELRILDF